VPHLVLDGALAWAAASEQLVPVVRRWGRAVLKTDGCWLRLDGEGLLVEGVVVELNRPLHPVAMVTAHHDDTIVRLWSLVPVERTPAVQRWLALLAADLQSAGGGPVKRTNLPPDVLAGVPLRIVE
jgi:hypothetical protein